MVRLFFGALLLALFGCSSKSVPVQTTLVTDSCVSPGPLDGVTHLDFRVTGDGMSPLDETFPVNAHKGELDGIPPGRNRVLEVRGYVGDPAEAGRVVSVGRSLPFDVPDVVPAAGVALPAPTVVLRRVNAFTPPGSSAGCNEMATPRAGHSATLLADGRVLIAGGYALAPGGRQTLRSTEIFDPATGTFSAGPDLGTTDAQQTFVASPRAFHTATALPSGQVLIAGGELVETGEPLGSALLFDPVSQTFGGLKLSTPRTRHAAAADKDGRVLLVGGVGAGGGLADVIEWFDPTTGQTATGGSLPVLGASVFGLGDRSRIVVAGGSDGRSTRPDVLLFSYSAGAFVQLAGPTMRDARRDAAIAPFGDQDALLVAGGYADAANPATAPLASSELITPEATPTLADGPAIQPRGGLCAASLLDGQLLTAGGMTLDDQANLVASDAVELITQAPNGSATALGMPALPVARTELTCTTLADGSVLILGGFSASPFGDQVLQDALIFTPTPKN